MNQHNLHYWSKHNPYWIQKEFIQGRKVDGLLTYGAGYITIAVTFIFDENINREH